MVNDSIAQDCLNEQDSLVKEIDSLLVKLGQCEIDGKARNKGYRWLSDEYCKENFPNKSKDKEERDKFYQTIKKQMQRGAPKNDLEKYRDFLKARLERKSLDMIAIKRQCVFLADAIQKTRGFEEYVWDMQYFQFAYFEFDRKIADYNNFMALIPSLLENYCRDYRDKLIKNGLSDKDIESMIQGFNKWYRFLEVSSTDNIWFIKKELLQMDNALDFLQQYVEKEELINDLSYIAIDNFDFTIDFSYNSKPQRFFVNDENSYSSFRLDYKGFSPFQYMYELYESGKKEFDNLSIVKHTKQKIKEMYEKFCKALKNAIAFIEEYENKKSKLNESLKILSKQRKDSYDSSPYLCEYPKELEQELDTIVQAFLDKDKEYQSLSLKARKQELYYKLIGKLTNQIQDKECEQFIQKNIKEFQEFAKLNELLDNQISLQEQSRNAWREKENYYNTIREPLYAKHKALKEQLEKEKEEKLQANNSKMREVKAKLNSYIESFKANNAQCQELKAKKEKLEKEQKKYNNINYIAEIMNVVNDENNKRAIEIQQEVIQDSMRDEISAIDYKMQSVWQNDETYKSLNDEYNSKYDKYIKAHSDIWQEYSKKIEESNTEFEKEVEQLTSNTKELQEMEQKIKDLEEKLSEVDSKIKLEIKEMNMSYDKECDMTLNAIKSNYRIQVIDNYKDYPKLNTKEFAPYLDDDMGKEQIKKYNEIQEKLDIEEERLDSEFSDIDKKLLKDLEAVGFFKAITPEEYEKRKKDLEDRLNKLKNVAYENEEVFTQYYKLANLLFAQDEESLKRELKIKRKEIKDSLYHTSKVYRNGNLIDFKYIFHSDLAKENGLPLSYRLLKDIFGRLTKYVAYRLPTVSIQDDIKNENFIPFNHMGFVNEWKSNDSNELLKLQCLNEHFSLWKVFIEEVRGMVDELKNEGVAMIVVKKEVDATTLDGYYIESKSDISLSRPVLSSLYSYSYIDILNDNFKI